MPKLPVHLSTNMFHKHETCYFRVIISVDFLDHAGKKILEISLRSNQRFS
jgi:hypothetical protein